MYDQSTVTLGAPSCCLRCGCVGMQVLDVSRQRQMLQEFLELVDEDYAGKPLPTIPNIPPKPAQAPDPSQVCCAQARCYGRGMTVPLRI